MAAIGLPIAKEDGSARKTAYPVTIGVPVYNGEAMLDECLASLAAQTFTNFRVLIFDNASTDRTAEIAHRWCNNDQRFHYYCQKENRGAKQNFLDVLAAADTDYFMWRAYDDLSAPEFLEASFKAITSRKGVGLAAPLVISENLDGSKRRIRALPQLEIDQSVIAIYRRLWGSHASWFYGLWHRSTLNRVMAETWGHYPSDWASDHLALFSLLLNGSVAGAPGATFIQRIKRSAASPKRTSQILSDELIALRQKFQDACIDYIDARQYPLWKQFLLHRIAAIYARKRVYPTFKLMKLRWREQRARLRGG